MIENTWLCALWVLGYSLHAGFANDLTENAWCMVDVFYAIVYTQGLLMTAVESTWFIPGPHSTNYI